MSEPESAQPKAEDMLERVHAEATELRNFTITFLSLLLYVGIIIASTTHEQILRIDPVKLPLLDVEIPIAGFYWFMPVFLFSMHLYILVQHYLFSQLAFRFRKALMRESAESREHLRRNLGNLPFLHWLTGGHNGFMRFIMTLLTVLSLIVWPIWTFLWLQMAFLPYHDKHIVWTQQLLLVLDAGFLAYLWAKILDDQDNARRWWQPLFAGFVIVPIAGFQAAKALLHRLHPNETDNAELRRMRALDSFRQAVERLYQQRFDCKGGIRLGKMLRTLFTASVPSGLLASFLLAVAFLSIGVANLPDSTEEQWMIRLNSVFPPAASGATVVAKHTDGPPRQLYVLTEWLHENRKTWLESGEVKDYDPGRIRPCGETASASVSAGTQTAAGSDAAKPETDKKQCYRVDSWFPRNLILRERVLVANKKLSPELRATLGAGVTEIKPEQLAKAEGLNLQGRHLEYADFSESSLPNADLRRARLKFANFYSARLDQVTLQQAELHRAVLIRAKLSRVDLFKAELHGANLSWAQLPDANLSEAKLPGADLSWAKFFGANLSWAQLPNANLSRAQFSGANLSGAQLPGANLPEAQFPGANLSRAKLPGANLSEAELPDANLSWAQLPGANLSEAQFPGANLSMAQLPGANLSEAQFPGADLSMAQLPGAILGDIRYASLKEKDLKNFVVFYRDALDNLSRYQGEAGKHSLDKKVERFHAAITHPAVLSIDDEESRGCLANAAALKDFKPCSDITQPQAQHDAYEQWVQLACADTTEQRWIAQAMIWRAMFFKKLGLAVYPTLLAVQLKNPDTCPGLAGLEGSWKKQLLDLAKAEQKANKP